MHSNNLTSLTTRTNKLPPQRQLILLSIFSNHLLIDTVLSCIPKLGLLYFFSDLTRTVCVSATQWHHSPSPLLDKRGGMMPEDPHRALKRKRQCEVSFLVAQIALLAILVVWTAAQWSLGMAIRGYAVRLEAVREGRERSADADLEKAELDAVPRETGYAAEEKKGLLRVGELEVERVEKVR